MQIKSYSMTDPLSKKQETIPLLVPESSEQWPGIFYFFTTRHGGVSQGAYSSLNLGTHVQDDPLAVARNRQRLTACLGDSLRGISFLDQVHGTTTITVDSHPLPHPAEADAQICRETGILLAIMTADCAPLLFADPQARIIGAAHAGWRGALHGVSESCLQAMCNAGASINEIYAIIGPCIHSEFYTVDPSFYETFAEHAEKMCMDHKKFFSKQNNTGKLRFDLPGYLRERLEMYGLSKERIHDAKQCTYSRNNDFFSHRHATQGNYAPCGRQMGGILLV
ncbi:peptidoglycan editing factor PgeF [Candidatus Magnetaquicoccus inordinatus]|uniref:peptidoglycan editing factor PgeF n=1 Tax=Candidatus Magnetaquicoccus inordinatus TaxID=2496818 RepID=UPI00102B778A|nr:peptidoglycan editing factor PgeF [Candidatus Magnetaquicoccus inordinatus]